MLIRVFPRKTKWTPDDDLSFVGDPPLFRPPEMPVKVSIAFTWDIEEGKRLQRSWRQFYSDVSIGGPAFNDSGDQFEPGMFIKKGVTITSRGCPKRCDFCFVPEREGKIRELKIKDGYIVCDNNLLACSKYHIENVFKMLSKQRHSAQFKGGLDAELFKPWHKELLDSIRVSEMFFACDTPYSIKPLEKVANILNGYSINKKRCFVLIGRTPIDECENRVRTVYSMGFLPFVQLYQPKDKIKYNKEWKDLARKWSRPAAYRSVNNAGQTGEADTTPVVG